MATIGKGETPFDRATKEELHDWLSHPVTGMLIAGMEQRLSELDAIMLGKNPALMSDEELGAFTRMVLIARADRLQIIGWIKGADHAS